MAILISKISFLLFLSISLSTQSSISPEQNIQSSSIETQPLANIQEVTRSLKANPDYGNIPLYFIPNKGQVHEKALFYARTSRYTLWITNEGLVFDSTRRIKKNGNSEPYNPNFNEGHKPEDLVYERDVSRLTLLNANENPEVVTLDITGHRVNYFKGNDPSKWYRNIETSKAVLYKEIYKNIDLKIYGVEKQIEYDWVVKPGGNPKEIRFEYKNVRGTRIDKDGNLVIKTEFGELRHKKPESYQIIENNRVDVEVEFKRVKENTCGYEINEYNKEYLLIIDPLVLFFSTYIGGYANDYGQDIKVDNSGNTYICGTTSSSDFPTTPGAFDTNYFGKEVFITKINSTGNGLIYSTYLGGKKNDYGNALEIDGNGNAYVTGETLSSDFPVTSDAYDKSLYGTGDGFIAKINASGTNLLYSTYLGGRYRDGGRAMTIDTTGNAYVTGITESTDFPITPNAFDKTCAGTWDIFITKLNSTGTGLVYSTFLGGESVRDYSNGIAVDGNENAYVTGYTQSSDFPTTPGAYDSSLNGSDAFITKLNSTGTGLVYSTFLGGAGSDEGWGITIDGSENAYVTGYTQSSDFPTTPGAYDSSFNGDRDAFITKLNSTGTGLEYSTLLGGVGFDRGEGIAIDGSENAYVTGYTQSSDFPTTPGAYDSYFNGDRDAFITKLNSAGTGLVYSTFLGGVGFDKGWGIAVDGSENAYVTGYTESNDFPTTPGAYDTDFNWGQDVFVAKMSFSQDIKITITSPNGGESWQRGTTKDITWTQTGLTSDVMIELYKAGTKVLDLGTASASSGTYSWDIPSDLETGSDYKVRIYQGSVEDYSDGYFSITNGIVVPHSIEINKNNWKLITGYSITIKGQVLDSIENPLQNVTVGVEDPILKVSNEFGTTDSNGQFSYTVNTYAHPDYYTLPRNYTFVFYAGGSGDCFSEVTIAVVPQGEEFDIKLENFKVKVGVTGTDPLSENANLINKRTQNNPFCPAGTIEERTNTAKTFGFYFLEEFISSLITYLPQYFGLIESPSSSVVSEINKYTTGPVGMKVTKKLLPDSMVEAAHKIVDSLDKSEQEKAELHSIIKSENLLWSVGTFPLYGSTIDKLNGITSIIMSADKIIKDKNGITQGVVLVGSNENETQVFCLCEKNITSFPEIKLDRTQLNFGASLPDTGTPLQKLLITNSGSGTLNWSISSDASWLSCIPLWGTGNGKITVSTDLWGVSSGTYSGTITVSDPNASNSPQTINVTLNVFAAGTSSEPFGVLSTPVDGSTVSSSIPVTGWALDDVGVESVKIYREEGGALVYLGDAMFVEGARPDVEQAYPNYPMNYKAGWGYMLLTNFLPNGGNGTFPLQAFAFDKEGHSVYLGTKTITCDNANAVKPFGAIDTPTQGGEASGSAFVNFGWALTPMPNSIPTGGSTINVYVDSVNIGHPVYNNYREDIANNFPGYANSGGAVGYFYFDTTGYTDGVHTIFWTTEDSAGNADGIGSRYFTIANTGSSVNAQMQERSQRKALDIPLSFESVMNLPINYDPISYRRGFKTDIAPETAVTDNYGVTNIEIREVERIEILLNHEPSAMSYEPSATSYSGYMAVGDQICPLPIGSTLDTENGIFYWQPGPGFIGEYDFVFIKKELSGLQNRVRIRIRIIPKFSFQ